MAGCFRCFWLLLFFPSLFTRSCHLVRFLYRISTHAHKHINKEIHISWFFIWTNTHTFLSCVFYLFSASITRGSIVWYSFQCLIIMQACFNLFQLTIVLHCRKLLNYQFISESVWPIKTNSYVGKKSARENGMVSRVTKPKSSINTQSTQ